MSQRSMFISFDAISGCEELRANWDALFAASDSRLPLSRWEQVELWWKTFAANRRCEVLVVERDGRWLAGLPLIKRKLKGALPVWDVPYDDWTGALELLVARDVANDPGVFDQLVAQLRKSNRPLLRVAQFAPQATGSEGLVEAFTRAGRGLNVAPRHEIGVIDIAGSNAPANWDAYQGAWSGNFRRQMRKMARRAEELGGVELIVHRHPQGDELASLIQNGFEIEDRGWKGREGTSVIRSPGMLEYFQRQAGLLAARGELILLFLKHKEELIAFEFGWSFRRIYLSPKVGFDERFGHLSPGQMLRYLWVERLFADRSHDHFDFAGPLAEATEKWITSRYAMSRIFAATNWLGDGLIRGHGVAKLARDHINSTAARLRSALSKVRSRPVEPQQEAASS